MIVFKYWLNHLTITLKKKIFSSFLGVNSYLQSRGNTNVYPTCIYNIWLM